ncbi:hypothetical protein SAMN05444166_1070 [Singulisphaera sp. GP187]|uniref:hypothetical protein n=1 Tax=Singulisphaera sp. GP187 TaxID=1882752 RepID=UPI000929ADC8|nr:hypothetical protein [Singulisphaera sp. GP187]SIN81796.1 hypothetical protein SAMN05444166_1070 [Singulisphaera sp. GP187]
MHHRSFVPVLLLSMLVLSTFVGCDSAPATTMAPKGHDGNAHGKIDTPVGRSPTPPYTGPRR